MTREDAILGVLDNALTAAESWLEELLPEMSTRQIKKSFCSMFTFILRKSWTISGRMDIGMMTQRMRWGKWTIGKSYVRL